jgi:hypothetical protein
MFSVMVEARESDFPFMQTPDAAGGHQHVLDD